MGEKYEFLKRTTAMIFVLVVVGSLLVGANAPSDPANRANAQGTTSFVDTTETTFNDTVRENRTRNRSDRQQRRQRGTALVRFAHMAQNASAVDVYVDGRRLNQSNVLFGDLGYGNVTGYLRVPAGEHRVTVTAANDRSDRRFRGTITFARDGRFTLAATRRTNDGLRLQTFRDRIVRPGPGEASVRVVNLAQNAPAVSLRVTRPRDGQRQGNQSRRIVARRVASNQASQYQSVSARFYTIDVVQASDRSIVFASVNRSLERGTVYTVFVAGRGQGANTAEDSLDVFVNVDGVRSGGDGRFGTTVDGFYNGTTNGGFFGGTTEDGFFNGTTDGRFTATTEDGFFNDTTDGRFTDTATTDDGFFDGTTDGRFNDTTEDGFFNDTETVNSS